MIEHKHQHNFEHLLVQFHKAQCYFSATIQIAALSFSIFEIDMSVVTYRGTHVNFADVVLWYSGSPFSF